MSPGLYSRSLSDAEEEEEQASQLVGGRGTEGEVCLLSSMCRKSETKGDDGGREGWVGGGGWGGGSAPVTLAVLCRSEGSRDSGERSPLCLVTPGSGRGRPFCSRSRWGPGTSTHPVCHMTWGKESPERKNRRVSGEIHLWLDIYFPTLHRWGSNGGSQPRKETCIFHLTLLFFCIRV